MSILDKMTCVLGFMLLVYFLFIKPSCKSKTKEIESKDAPVKIIKNPKLICVNFEKNKGEKK